MILETLSFDWSSLNTSYYLHICIFYRYKSFLFRLSKTTAIIFMISSIIKLILFSSSFHSVYSTNFNFQSTLNALQPQSPNTPTKRSQQQQQQGNQGVASTGGDYNPYLNGNNIIGKRPDRREWHYESTAQNRPNDKFLTNTEWFPSLSGNTRSNNDIFDDTGLGNSINSYDHHNNIANLSLSINSDLQEKLALIHSKNYYISSASLPRDIKLLSLAHEILSSASAASSRPLNILHLGSGSGFIPIALAVFSRPVDWIISLDDSISNSAKENIYRDGKEIFLNRLKFSQVPNFATAQIPRAPNSLPYDLIVSSKAIDQYTSIPLSLKTSLVPRGIIIYPEEANAGSLNRRIKVDKIDEYGNLQTIKTAEL